MISHSTADADRKAALHALDLLLKDLEERCRAAYLARQMLAGEADLAQEDSADGVEPRLKRWVLRRATISGAIVELLLDAADHGLSEEDIVRALSARGVPTAAKDPRRAVHWALYNVRRRSGAIERGVDKRWRIVGKIPTEDGFLERATA
jgi:hypothetical protein